MLFLIPTQLLLEWKTKILKTESCHNTRFLIITILMFTKEKKNLKSNISEHTNLKNVEFKNGLLCLPFVNVLCNFVRRQIKLVFNVLNQNSHTMVIEQWLNVKRENLNFKTTLYATNIYTAVYDVKFTYIYYILFSKT